MMNSTRRRSQIPGSRFNPSDVELINNYLRRRIERNKPSRYITDKEDVYEKEPWLLTHVSNPKFYKNQWYYFVKRNKLAGVSKTDSKRTSRTVGGAGFTWKSSTSTPVVDKRGVKVGGSKQILSLVLKVNRKTEKSTGWVMHEFLLDKPGFQELVLCRIRFNPCEDNPQYAPRFETRVIEPQAFGSYGSASEVSMRNQSIMEEQYHGQGYVNMVENENQIDLSQVPAMNQALEAPMYEWVTGSCFGETVSYSIAQNQEIMEQDYYPMNGVMEKQQDHFGYYYFQGLCFGGKDPSQVPMMMNLGQDMVAMTQGVMDHHQEQYLVAQPMNGVVMKKHQDYFDSCGNEFMRESLGLGQQQNKILEETTHLEKQVNVPIQQDMEKSQEEFQEQGKNQTMQKPPCLPQEDVQEQPNEQAMSLPMNQVVDKDIIVVSSTRDVSIGDKTAPITTDQEMMNLEIVTSFGNQEWLQDLGKNTEEEEAELMAALGENCNTLDSLLNYFCPL